MKNELLFRAPADLPTVKPRFTVFLAGSIEQGKAEPWQTRVAERLVNEDVCVFDPRRDDWDESWVQDPTLGTQFERQVSWEQDAIELADLVLFRFWGGGPAIVSMLELGQVLGSGKPVVICCDPEYMRRGNIVVTAKRCGLEVFDTLDEALRDVLRIVRAASR